MNRSALRSPQTVAMLKDIAELIERKSWTQECFRQELNKFLPDGRHIPATHSGAVMVNRLLNYESKRWSEPSAETAIALKKLLDKFN